MTDTRHTKICTNCHMEKPNTTEYFYKGKKILRACCKVCANKKTVAHPNHKVFSNRYYYNNSEKIQQQQMKNYILQRVGVALVK